MMMMTKGRQNSSADTIHPSQPASAATTAAPTYIPTHSRREKPPETPRIALSLSRSLALSTQRPSVWERRCVIRTNSGSEMTPVPV